MNVEVGISAGPGISVGPAISAGAEVGLGARFGPSISGLDSFASLPIIVNESPAGLLGLENTMPYKLDTTNLIGSIKFFQEPLSVPTVIAEAESILSQVPLQPIDRGVPDVFQLGLGDINLDPTSIEVSAPRFDIFSEVNQIANKAWGESLVEPVIQVENNFLSEEVVVAEANHWLGIGVAKPTLDQDTVKLAAVRSEVSYLKAAQPTIGVAPLFITVPEIVASSVVKTKNVLAVHAVSEPHTKTGISNKITQATSTPLVQEQPKQEAIETVVQKKLVEEETVDKPAKTTSEEIIKKRLVIDETALANRLTRGRLVAIQAYQYAKSQGKEIVTGEDAGRLVPKEYSEVRSEVLKKKENSQISDGSYEATVADINKIGAVSSEAELIQRVERTIYEHEPLREVQGDGGTPAKIGALEEVFKHKVVKPPIEVKLVIRKIEEVKVPDSVTNLPEWVSIESVEVGTDQVEGPIIQDHPALAEALKAA